MEENDAKIGFLNKVKNHFTTHAFGYVMTSVAVASAMVAVELIRARDVKLFLYEKGIDPQEYLNPERYKELKNS